MIDRRAEKRSLRRTLVERILSLNLDDRRGQEQELATRFATLPGYEAAESVLLYVSVFPEEIVTRPMLEHALAAGKRLICPRVDRAEKCLRLHQVHDLENDLRPGMRGIPEPSGPEVDPRAIDWVLVPGLGFDDRAYRIGRGAGHYDQLLPLLRPEVPRWALAFDCQWVESLPLEPHDVPLDGVAFAGRMVRRDARGTGFPAH